MSLLLVLISGGLLFSAHITSAHEAYVLPYNTFWNEMHARSTEHVVKAFENPHNIYITLCVASSILLLLVLNFFFRRSKLGMKWERFLEWYSYLGPHFVRIALAIAFFFSASTSTFLGPELLGSLFPYPHLLQVLLFAIAIMIAIGFLTEVAALVGIIIFLGGFMIFGQYMLNYLNYLGELIVLLLFGMRVFSLDKYLLGPLRRFRTFEKYETLIVRVFYGLALIYAAITVKLLHPDVTIDVVNTWHLTNFHLLFPSDPLLVTLGAGIVEIIIGFFILIGFEMRMTILISLFYMTLSLFYFREMVWPHLVLYGISLSLLVQPEVFTLDHILFKHHRKAKRWWKRPLSPHRNIGKSHQN